MIIFFIFSIAISSLQANGDVDSLKSKLKTATLEERILLKVEIAQLLLRKDPLQAENYAKTAKILAQDYGYDFELASTRRILGNIRFLNQNWVEALSYYQSGIEPAVNSGNLKILGDLYYNSGRCFTNLRQYASALESYRESLFFRKKLDDREDETTTLNSLGLLFWEQVDFFQAVYYFKAAEQNLSSIRNQRLSATVLNNLGNALIKTGEVAAAGEAYIRSLRIRESYGSPAELAAANLNLGNLFYTSTNYKEAELYYLEAKRFYTEIGDEMNVGFVYGNLGSIYSELNLPEKAIENHLIALEIYRRHGMKENQSKTLNNIGNLYLREGIFDQAQKYYDMTLEIKKQIGDTKGLATTYNNISELFYNSGRYEEALEKVQLSYDFAKTIPDQKMILNNYRQFAKIYEILGDHEKAILFYKKYIELDLEVYALDKKDAIAEMKIRFFTEEKEKEITELQNFQEFQADKLAKLLRARMIILFLAFTSLVIAVFFALLYRSKQSEVKKRVAVQNELEKLNGELEEKIKEAVSEFKKHQLILSQKSKLEALGNLTAGIAHEINQPLSAISMSIDNIQLKSQKGQLTEDYLSGKFNRTHEDIQRIREIIEHVRLFSRNEKETHFEELDINRVIEEAIILTKQSLKKMRISLTINFTDDRVVVIGNKYKFEQVILNLINNAKDAIEEKNKSGKTPDQENNITITTYINQSYYVVEVFDNGTGVSEDIIDKVYDPFFTTKNPDRGTGLGLSISYGIISDMKGIIEINSEINKFTQIQIKLPYYRK